MRFRKLRIAWSVVWGLAAVLLLVLWVRSYGDSDSIAIPQNFLLRRIEIISQEGRLAVRRTSTPEWWNSVRNRAYFEAGKGYWIPGESEYFGSDGKPMTTRSILIGGIPHELVALLLALVAPYPWLPWPRRFSLRTLLIATTLVAVVLGLIVAVCRTS